MSSIPPGTSIVSSVAQGALQQSQAAKAQDMQRNRRQEQSQRMRQLIEKHLQTVEDSFEASDEHLVVQEDEHSPNQPDPEQLLEELNKNRENEDIPRLDIQA